MDHIVLGFFSFPLQLCDQSLDCCSQDAEKRGVSPEEVYAALSSCGSSNVNPCDWLASELPHLLDEICAMAASVQLNYKAGHAGTQPVVEMDGGDLEQSAAGGVVKLSRAEAKLAWLAAGGDMERAVRQLLRDRQTKVGNELTTPGLKGFPIFLVVNGCFQQLLPAQFSYVA